MVIAQSELLRAGQRRPPMKSQVRAGLQKTAFPCHSNRDSMLAEGLQALLAEQGLVLYIDWQDASMPPDPSRETAARLQQRIKASDWFLFLATANSMASRWCPWELGYADCLKPLDRIAIVPTSDGRSTHGTNICSSIGAWMLPAAVICSGCQPAATRGSTSAASPPFEAKPCRCINV